MIRPMSEADIPEIAVIERASFSRPWSEGNFKESLELSDALFVVSEDDITGELKGYLGMYFSPDEMGIMNVAVAPEHRGNGVGDELLTHAMKVACDREVLHIYLEVRVSNLTAQNLYKKHGLKELGIRKNLYEDPTEDGIVMGKDIEYA